MDGVWIAICFIVGAFLSASAGWIGMSVATDANVRTTQAARARANYNELNEALRVAFTGGNPYRIDIFRPVGKTAVDMDRTALLRQHSRVSRDRP